MNRIPDDLQSAIAAASAESPYERLGVTPHSSTADRKRAYRALSRLLHPDVIRDSLLRPRCNDALVRVNEAFEILSDPIRELAWRARNSFTMPGTDHHQPASSPAEPFSPPPPSDHPEVRELASLLVTLINNFTVEKLEQTTERLIHRLLYARDCRLFIFDPQLRAAAERLVSYLFANVTDSSALSPAVSLVRLFLFDQSHPLYRRLVATLLSRIRTILTTDAPLNELDTLVAAVRPLDSAAALLRNPEFIEPFSRRLRRALLWCRTDRSCEVDRVILLRLQDRHGCLPTDRFTEIAQEVYASLLSTTEGPTEAADLRRRLHLTTDDALAIVAPLLERALETGDIERSLLYIHLLRFELSREREIARRLEKISDSLISYFSAFSRTEDPHRLVLALSLLKHLPDELRAELAKRASLRRGALAAYHRSRPVGIVPPHLHPRALLGASFVDRLCSAFCLR